MSRSYRKPKAFNAGGRNTEYYRERNRNTRNKNKQILNKLSVYKNSEIGYDNFDNLDLDSSDYLNFIPNKKNPSYDTWCEPTDGSFMPTKEQLKGDNAEYFNKLRRK